MKHPIHTAIILTLIFIPFLSCYDRSASNFYIAREYQKLLSLGKMDRSQDNYRKIDKYFLKSLEANPDNPVVNMHYADFLLSKDKVLPAVRHFKRAIELKPDYFACHVRLAFIYAIRDKNTLHDRNAALRHLSQAENLVDRSNPTHLRILADAYEVNKRPAKAFKTYNIALGLDSKDVILINNFAIFLATVEDKKYRNPKRALKLAKRAVALSRGKQAIIIDTLAEAHYANGNYKEAVLQARRAIFLSNSATESKIFRTNLKRFEKALKEKRNP